MARIRTIKPEFWGDEKLAPLAPVHRLVFLGLISQADDAGRLVDSVRTLDGLLFPDTEDSCTESLSVLADKERIRRYLSKSGQRLIQICNWERHQKVKNPSPYVLPAPSGGDSTESLRRTGGEHDTEDDDDVDNHRKANGSGHGGESTENGSRSGGDSTESLTPRSPIPDPLSPIPDLLPTIYDLPTLPSHGWADVENAGNGVGESEPGWGELRAVMLATCLLGREEGVETENGTIGLGLLITQAQWMIAEKHVTVGELMGAISVMRRVASSQGHEIVGPCSLAVFVRRQREEATGEFTGVEDWSFFQDCQHERLKRQPPSNGLPLVDVRLPPPAPDDKQAAAQRLIAAARERERRNGAVAALDEPGGEDAA